MLEILADHNDRNDAHCPTRNFDNQSANSWQKWKRKNVTPIT